MSTKHALSVLFLLAALAYCRNVIPVDLKVKRSVLVAATEEPKYTPPDPKKTPHNGTTVPLKQLIFGPVFIGSNSTGLEVMYDTGSPWLWVNDVTCKSCSETFNMDPGFNCTASTTCGNTKETTYWQYGIGSTDAVLVKERVSFGPNLTIQDYVLGLATDVGDSYDMSTFNGICGLGLGRWTTVIDALKDQHQIQERVFSMALNSDDGHANLFLGGIDMNHIDLTKPWYTFKLSGQSEWKSDLSGISVMGQEIKSPVFRDALFDSGTSHLILDSETFEEFIKATAKHNITCEGGDFSLECTIGQNILKNYSHAPVKTEEDVTKLINQVFPTLTFTMSGQKFTLEPSYYATSCNGDTKTEITCGFLVAPFNIDVIILGDPLFKKYYVSFFEDESSVLLFHSPKSQPKLRYSKERPQLSSSFLGRH